MLHHVVACDGDKLPNWKPLSHVLPVKFKFSVASIHELWVSADSLFIRRNHQGFGGSALEITSKRMLALGPISHQHMKRMLRPQTDRLGLLAGAAKSAGGPCDSSSSQLCSRQPWGAVCAAAGAGLQGPPAALQPLYADCLCPEPWRRPCIRHLPPWSVHPLPSNLGNRHLQPSYSYACMLLSPGALPLPSLSACDGQGMHQVCLLHARPDLTPLPCEGW